MVGAFVVAGGALCAGYGIYRYRIYQAATAPSGINFGNETIRTIPSESSQLTMSLRNMWARLGPKGYTRPPHEHHQNLPQNNHADLWASAALAGTAVIGGAVGGAGVIPLKYIAIPALAYRGLPAMHSTIDMALNDRKATRGLLETTALAIVLIKGAWIVGTVGFAVYHLGRWVITATDDIDSLATTSYLVERQNQTMTIPAKQIKAGDWISVSASHAIPVKSKVMDGTAWIYPRCHTSDESPLTVKPGDLLEKDSIVLAGDIWLEATT